MWSLVYKDFYQQRKGLRFLLLWGIGLFAFTALSDTGLGMIPLFIFIAGTNFALRFSYHEEKNYGLSFLRSLPLKPNYIVGRLPSAALPHTYYPQYSWALAAGSAEKTGHNSSLLPEQTLL
ncbi:MAG TPA: hypothetical protein GXX69_02495, partial [Firmicutes bacterium]|nr:hypothetical protein [Bacillota bacterium]